MSRDDSGGNEQGQPHHSDEAGSDEAIESDASTADQDASSQNQDGRELDAEGSDVESQDAADHDTGPVAASIAAADAAAGPASAAPLSGRSAARKPRPAPSGKRSRKPGRTWFGGRYPTSSVALGGLACLLAIVLVAGFLTAYLKYREVWDSITRVDVSADLHSSKLPPADPNAMNILLIGSDSRSGENGKIGGSTGISGQRSDTVMLVHIAPGERQIVVISFPRDTVVPILACTPEDGAPGQTAQPGQIEQLNATFAYGGPGCLWETLEEETGIHINDFMELTFVGFEQAINALGGVNVCLPETVHDSMSGLNLGAGNHHIWGGQALEFWRTREDLGEGDDLQRIVRDQYLMAALMQGIEHSGLLTSPSKMLGVLDALTSNRNITVDEQLSLSEMLRIAEDLRGISSESVQFVTSPYTSYVPNPNWVQWEEPQAEDLFAAVARDNSLPKSHSTAKKSKKSKKVTTKPTPTPQPSSSTSVQPSQVKVAVYNGADNGSATTSNLATTTSAALTARGFDVVGQPLDAASNTYTDSVIQYASAAYLPEAQLLEQEVGPVGDVQLQLDPQLAGGTMNLILGSTFSTLQPAPTSSPLENIAGTYGGITGNVNICSDKAAFAGPDGQ